MEYIHHETSELTDILLSNVPPEERIAFATSAPPQQQQHDEDLTWADLDLEILTGPAIGETRVGLPKVGQCSDELFAQIDTGVVVTSLADEQQPQHIAFDYNSCREDRLYFDYEWVAEPSHDQRFTDDAVVPFDQTQHDIAAAIHVASEHASSTENTHRPQPLAAEPYQQQPSDVGVPSDQQLPSEERIAFATSHKQQHDGDLTWADLDLDILAGYAAEPAASVTQDGVPTDEQLSNGSSIDITQSQWIQPLAAEPNQQQQLSYVDGSSGHQQVSDTPFINMTSAVAHGSVMMSQPTTTSGYQFIGYPAVGVQLLNPTQQCQFMVQNPPVETQLLQPVSGSSALYQCPHAGCAKTFKTRSSIQRHVNVIHAGIKAHACDLCGQRFGQKTHLTAHLRKHTGEQPFACLLCDKAYKHNVDLRKHMNSVHQLNITK